ncbi:MAG: GNAT family protein [Myxococcota bacterium]
MAEISTRRLRLRTLSPECLRASLSGDRPRAENLLGASLPGDWPDDPELLRIRLEQVEADPTWEPWLTRVMVLSSAQRVIGVIGFHGPPGGEWLRDFAPGGVEFGYSVYPEWRRQGFAREASQALMAWATLTAETTTFALSMSPKNEASVGLAKSLGFSKVGTWEHPARGTEHVYRFDAGD